MADWATFMLFVGDKKEGKTIWSKGNPQFKTGVCFTIVYRSNFIGKKLDG